MTTSIPLKSALAGVPVDVVDSLEAEYVSLEARFSRRDWGPAELNGGRFAEAVLRYLEWKQSGAYTPLGDSLNRSVILDRVRKDTSVPDGLRFHVAKCSEVLMDIRNKRDVAHLGAVVDVDEMDAHLIMRMASWMLAEMVREESTLSPQDSQMLIDRLSSRRLPLVEEIGGDRIVVATDLTAKERALVLLYDAYPQSLTVGKLRESVRYKNTSRFRQILVDEVSEGILHLKGEDVYLTGKGVVWVETNIDLRLSV